ncbi:RNA chaperone ProQ [Aestuariibacter salexigens]|uniref:RNA chaperone ProQ n=1 Tax=Aestuariibacter salexigens TaxID=226010 RepID=UPI00047EF6C9|nr:RNA chaperone ProQ [Aestuariibacter salexigens]
MDTQEKFTTSKEVIAFLAQSFPNCFSLEGDAKPLKIGIFQDLAERLEQDERVSKTLLRTSLRHYTNSWRYLHSMREGAHRVDLDGNQDAVIEQEHAEHAKQQLEESKARVAEKRKQTKGPKKPRSDVNGGAKRPKNSTATKTKTTIKGTKPNNSKPKSIVPAQKLTDDDLKSGTRVTVKVGREPMLATITEVAKDGINVQLDTGMSVKVQQDKLRLARSKR